MFHLHLSNRTENLLARLIAVLRDQPRRDLFAREVFLIQSQGMERMLSQRLADAFAVWCNFEYLLPTRFFEIMAARMDLALSPDAFNREALAWRIDALLHQIARQEPPQPLFAPLLRYMSGEQAALKRFQLARQLANCFDQYQIMRPAMLEGWQQGKTTSDNPAEPWQMAIWAQLRASLDHVPHRGEMLRLFLEHLHGSDDLSAILPARLSIFGLHSMPPLLLDCLAGVARHSDVHLYLLSPCRNYWADLPGKRQLIRENLARLKTGLEPAPIDPGVHPLLNSLGRQGRDFQTMLLERVDELIDSDSFEDPADHGPNGQHPPCLLHRLQSDLLDGAWPVRDADAPLTLDSSLTIASCHSPAREIMALKDQILRWLQDNPDMELRDIVVMAPDIQEYAAIIPAIFHDIQHSIADRSLRHQNRVLALFFRFLDLAVSRCSWSGVLDLLEAPEIAAAFGELTEADIELIRHWVVSAGIRWGLSSEQLQAMGLPGAEETTWQAGLDRLLMGYAMEWNEPVDGVLPYPDIEGSQARPLGGLRRFVELLTRTAAELARPRPLAAWSARLLFLTESLFGPDTGDDLVRLRELLSDLAIRFGGLHQHAQAKDGPVSPEPGTAEGRHVPLEVIRSWLESAARETRTSAGFLRGRLTFCSMLPMRSIPFRAVCLLGLNDGVFPGADRHPPFDLLGRNFQPHGTGASMPGDRPSAIPGSGGTGASMPGDRSRRNDDRYQFLEALLSARQYLYLSHVGQSIRSGREIPPSVLISELIETLRLSYGIEEPVRKHPLQPFSPRYFRGDGLFSYNEDHCRVARALQPPPPPQAPGPWWSGTLPEVEDGTIAIADLLAFFAHPQRWFVRNRLDIRLDTEAELPEENELFSVSGLTGYGVNQELVQTLLEPGAPAPAAMLARLKAQGRWMLGAPGELRFNRLLPELQGFADGIAALDMGPKRPDLAMDLVVDGARLTGQLKNRHANGILLFRYSNCKGKDLLAAWIHHLLWAAARPGRRPSAVLGSGDTGPSLACAPATHLLSRDRAFSFAPCDDPLAHLSQLLAIFRQGCAAPSPLLVEPAWQYVQQQDNDREKTSLLQAVSRKLQDDMDKGYEPELTLLYGDCDPAILLGPAFEQLCRDVFSPIFATTGRATP